jgi:hypothetical protein
MAAVMVAAAAAALEAVVVEVVARSPALVPEECKVAEGQPADVYRCPLPQVLQEPYQYIDAPCLRIFINYLLG